MESNVIGKVTMEERTELLTYYERKLGIEELMNSFKSNLLSDVQSEKLMDKMILEAGKVKMNTQAWWDRMYEKYQWERVEGHNWNINFDTCEISLL